MEMTLCHRVVACPSGERWPWDWSPGQGSGLGQPPAIPPASASPRTQPREALGCVLAQDDPRISHSLRLLRCAWWGRGQRRAARCPGISTSPGPGDFIIKPRNGTTFETKTKTNSCSVPGRKPLHFLPVAVRLHRGGSGGWGWGGRVRRGSWFRGTRTRSGRAHSCPGPSEVMPRAAP